MEIIIRLIIQQLEFFLAIMEGLKIVIPYLFLFLLDSTEILGALTEASTSASNEIVECGPKHLDGQNINSYVSFQISGSHICGGARLDMDQVLTFELCFEQLIKNYDEILAVILTESRKSYKIEKYKRVSNQFTIIMLTVPEGDRNNDVAVASLSKDRPDFETGVGIVGWNEETKGCTWRYSNSLINEEPNSRVLDYYIAGVFPFSAGFIGNLQFQYTFLTGIAKERTRKPFGTENHAGTIFVNIQGEGKEIQKALKKEDAIEFGSKKSSFKISDCFKCARPSTSRSQA